ncbi:MAG: hypothetical protein M1830_010798 [Pleopsidium flavum]|nr:MAG: hypothetical protein M1830_010798 [Pleopsidium flavum]
MAHNFKPPGTLTMSSANLPPGPQLAKEVQGGVALPPSPEKIQAKFDLSIAISLSLWPALTLAVQNSWGGPDSSDKRDWLAGAISDLFSARPDTDVDDVEEVLLQVLNDEFEVNVEDGSAEEVAARIVGLRKLTLEGDFEQVNRMYEKWAERQKRGGGSVKFQSVERRDEEDDTDWDSDDLEEGDEDGVEMEEAPQLVKVSKEKVEPQVDQDGFTKVVGKKKRWTAD